MRDWGLRFDGENLPDVYFQTALTPGENGLADFVTGVMVPLAAIDELTDEQLVSIIRRAKAASFTLAAIDSVHRGVGSNDEDSDLHNWREILLAGLSNPLFMGLEETMQAGIAEIDEELDRRRKKAEKEAAKHTPNPGFVYLIKVEQGQFKIGRTKNIAARKRAISLSIPFSTELIHCINTQHMGKTERSLHQKFANQRTNGEWFLLKDDDVTWIKSLKDLTGAEQW